MSFGTEFLKKFGMEDEEPTMADIFPPAPPEPPPVPLLETPEIMNVAKVRRMMGPSPEPESVLVYAKFRAWGHEWGITDFLGPPSGRFVVSHLETGAKASPGSYKSVEEAMALWVEYIERRPPGDLARRIAEMKQGIDQGRILR